MAKSTRKPARKSATKSASKSGQLARSVRFTLAQLGADAALVRDRARITVADAEHNLDDLRHHAAQAALHWVAAHEDRVRQLRQWLRGTRSEKVFNTVLAEIRGEAKVAPARRRTARRRAKP